ncbi:hypothetical protein ACGFIV_31315 [Sphaerisporangium sp. NPDC049003]|uniref:hypothetical protein n=1 Tax=Sphaerisporangium sp. NPDC049003 TaxID=3364517 RepID=UPI00371D6229
MIGINLGRMPGWVGLVTIDCTGGLARRILRTLLDHLHDRGIQPVRLVSGTSPLAGTLTFSQDEMLAHDVADLVKRIATELENIGGEPGEDFA